MKKALLASGLLAMSLPALAQGIYQQDGYVGLQYNMLNQETAGNDIKPGAFQTRFGLQFTPNVALEGRLGYGLQDDQVDGLTIDPKWVVGAYVKLGLDKSLPVSPYLLAGHSTVTADVTQSGLLFDRTQETTQSDISYGGGVDINLNKASAINVEWLKLDEIDNYDLTTINVGYMVRF
ncbi:MAG: porin family protein [Alcanivorax sp.]|nr:porin family protein [Alcanivorax sp.]